ncbi:Phosphate ABC transporter, periplasmic phosphate-binding protein PstS (TC 3.A.1.7.1) [hydrothermal vent metagenome]|uniref:Phosphate ABC transporter, periplasmic phosphate-binding protein PstS (TC 3.A.1.7.1) n=1 Tax=hydrothermal vent metagenome TaxID=652676 RepID=A0A3B0ZVI5_9ZZZZ
MVKSVSIFTLSLLLCLSTTSTYAAPQNASLIWAGCGITKKAFMAELAKAYEKKTGIVVNLNGGGATKGIRNAVKGQIDIGGACRPIIEGHPEERSAYQVPVAWDALVVIVHPKNPVKSISVRELQRIYLGKIKNWKQLGGWDHPIELYVRRGKISGVGRTLRELVFANFQQEFPGAKHIVRSSGPVEKGVQSNIYGIGTTGISSAKRRKVKMLQLNGKSPTYENIKSGSYVLYRPLYLVTRGQQSADKKVKEFITFALSRQGREVIRKAGSVPYSDAMGLVMKQLEQYDTATEKGLTQTSRN